MSTDGTNEDTSVVITQVDDAPPMVPLDSYQPIVDDDPMPSPYEELRHIKFFYKSAAVPLLSAMLVIPAIILVGFVDSWLIRTLISTAWLLTTAYIVLVTLRFWKEWRERPLSVPDPRSCTLYIDQRGVAWLYPLGMRDSPPDPFRLPEYELTTPARTFWEQTLFKNSYTLWLVKDDENEPPPSRQFKDVKDIKSIIRIWEWNRRQDIVQQDEVAGLLREVRDETVKNGVTLGEIRDALLELTSLMRP